MRERMKLYGYNLQEHHDEIFNQKNKTPVEKVEEKKVQSEERSANVSKLSTEPSKPSLQNANLKKEAEISRQKKNEQLYQQAMIKANKSPANLMPNNKFVKNERPISARAQLVKKKSEPSPNITPIKSEKKF